MEATPTAPLTPVLDLRGLWVPLVTPFDAAGRLDVAALRRLARRVLAEGARGVVALGTTGEPASLDERERRAVIDACVGVCAAAGRPLVVGVGSSDTRATVAAVEGLAGLPAVVAALVVAPAYVRPSPAGVVAHYRAVAASGPVPIIAYHIPYRTGCSLTAEHLLQLAAIDGVVGLKQAVGGLDVDTLELLRRAPAGFGVLAGDDAFIAATILHGGVGAITAAAHLCTPAFTRLVDAALDGDLARVRPLAAALLPVVRAGAAEPSPALWKSALHRRGELATASVRLPLLAGGRDETDALLAAAGAVDERWPDGAGREAAEAP